MNGIVLSGPQMGRLSAALRAAFPDPARLDEVLLYHLDINRANLTLQTNYPSRLLDILINAQAQNWTHKLIAAARASNPENPDLLAFAQEVGLGTRMGSLDNVPTSAQNSHAFEKTIKRANPFFDVVMFRTTLAQMEGRVCKIDVRGQGSGTGFLVGSDVVITNYHVMEPVFNGSASPSQVSLLFDYKRLADDALGEGTEYRLADEWRIFDTPYSPFDLTDPTSGKQDPEHLDFALVRLNARVAEQPVFGLANMDPKAPSRGYIAIPGAAHDFLQAPALFILQHPDGEPLKLAIDTDSVIAVNPGGTRVRYRTNTEPGSSGSPCFDAYWNLVALHHLGDPNWQAQYNQGIPFTAILALLAAKGLTGALGDQ